MKIFNRNLKYLVKCYNEGTTSKVGVCLEGSSRSAKTYSCIHFLIWLCNRAHIAGKPIVINIIRETYNSFKTTLYNDFNKILPAFGIDNPFSMSKEVSSFWIFGSKINLVGADKVSKFEGLSGDITYFNELLDIDNEIFDAAEQRTQRFWIADWNPKFSDHWVFRKILNRPDVGYLHSTFKDNPFISRLELKKILSYDPDNPVNVEAGTADDYRWSVYGLGKRTSPEGLIYPLVTWIPDLPMEYEKETYGLDFGYTNSPAALCQTRIHGNNLYAKKLLYMPVESAQAMAPILRKLIPEGRHFWCDSADPMFINDLRRLGFKALAVKKSPNYKMPAIGNIKRFKLHLVRDTDVQREQENYRYRTVHGITLDEPIDDFDHFFDALLYSALHEIRVSRD
jgi:phage terminase large subunit